MFSSDHFISDSRSKIAIIDDSQSSRAVLKSLLSKDYEIIESDNADQGMEMVFEHNPDIVLLDIYMPGTNGFQFCQSLKSNHKTTHIPVIFLSSAAGIEDKTKGYNAGGSDYITKPFIPDEVMLRVNHTLRYSRERQSLENLNLMLDEALQDRSRQIEVTRNAMLGALTALAEARDNETGHHILRTQHYVMVLGLHAIEKGLYPDLLDKKSVNYMFKAAPLHDIGKVGICDSVLQKPGALTAEERKAMQQHTIMGANVITVAEKHIGEIELMKYVKDIIISHHERWDGQGYPYQLAGEEIPVAGRIMAIADVYDALVSKRVYKDAYSHKIAVKIICEERGGQFDPLLVDCFLEAENQFKVIASKYEAAKA